jgi:predicted metal-dependent phosphoesterase TrpH
MTSFICRLPLPPSDLSPNRASHAHWRLRHGATDEYRMIARSCFKRDKPAGWAASHVELEMHYYCTKASRGYRPKDVQNALAAIKAAVDGMVDAGVVANDSKKFVSWGRLRLLTTAKEVAAAPPEFRVDHEGIVVLRVTVANIPGQG